MAGPLGFFEHLRFYNINLNATAHLPSSRWRECLVISAQQRRQPQQLCTKLRCSGGYHARTMQLLDAAEGSQTGSSIADLPDVVLARMLSCLPLQQRLYLATVSTAWKKAAHAATTAVTNTALYPKQFTSFYSYLAVYGSQLTSINLTQGDSNWFKQLMDLPWWNLSSLRELRLQCFTLAFGEARPATNKGGNGHIREGHSSQARSGKTPKLLGDIGAAMSDSAPRAGEDANTDPPAVAAGAGNSSAQAGAGSGGDTDAATVSASSSPGAAAAAAAAASSGALLPQLRVLDLTDCTINSNTLQQLTGLTALSELHIKGPDGVPLFGWEPGVFSHTGRVTAEFHAWLAQLPDLAQLTLHGSDIFGEALQPLSSMTKLRTLRATVQQNPTLQSMRSQEQYRFARSDYTQWPMPFSVPLSDSLTALHLDGKLAELTPRTAPFLCRLTALQDLSMGRYSLFAPELLQDLRPLRRLDLDGCILAHFVPAAHARTQGAGVPGAAGTAGAVLGTWTRPQLGDRVLLNISEAVRSPLSELQHMTQLQSLSLRQVVEQPKQQPDVCTALTASKQLTSLRLVMHGSPPLPCGALKSMFPHGEQLLHLRSLNVSCTLDAEDCMLGRSNASVWCVDQQELAAVAAACPGLQDVDLLRVLQQGSAVKALLPLKAQLTSLHLAGNTADNTAAAAAVRQLTGLRKLQWDGAHDLTDAGLQQLAALTGLTELFVYHCGRVGQQVYHWYNIATARQHLDPEYGPPLWLPERFKATWDPEQVGADPGATVCQQLLSALHGAPPTEL